MARIKRDNIRPGTKLIYTSYLNALWRGKTEMSATVTKVNRESFWCEIDEIDQETKKATGKKIKKKLEFSDIELQKYRLA